MATVEKGRSRGGQARADRLGTTRVDEAEALQEFRIDPLHSLEYSQLEHMSPLVSGCGALHVPLQGGLETLLGPSTLVDSLFVSSVVPIVRDSHLCMDEPRDVWNERGPQ